MSSNSLSRSNSRERNTQSNKHRRTNSLFHDVSKSLGNVRRKRVDPTLRALAVRAANIAYEAADDTDRFLKSVNNSIRRSVIPKKGGKSRRQTRKNNNRLTQRRKIEYINRQKRKTT